MYEYLNDIKFLEKIDKLRLKTHYAKIILLSFDKEEPLKEIQGTVTGGSLSVNGSSAVRRTISLSALSSIDNNDIEDLDNEISINKKIKVFIGFDNPFKEYDRVLWFPCGLFIISSANVSRSTTGWSISINGKDKMCLLDGTVGGVFPASITFHESLIETSEGNFEIQYPTIYKIIYEAVNHWGGESIENIIITDLDEKCKMLVRYMGDKPIYFDTEYTSMSFIEDSGHSIMKSYGEDVGYKETDFTYPDELVLNAGETVVNLLDKIIDILGNYEYFYDVWGRFHFQQIKNYLNTGSPLRELQAEDYIKTYNNAKFRYSLTDLDSVISITKNPNYDNLKNDFYVWGVRKTDSDIEVNIRYHLAIDTKPHIDLADQYMWKIYYIDEKNQETIVRYDFNEQENGYLDSEYKTKLIGKKSKEWREELYRRALVAQVSNSVYDNYYDSELLAEWRNLYDTMNDNWAKTNYWNPDVLNNPEKINFWLDFIDTNSALAKYSIKQIGRRTKVVNNSSIKTVYNSEVPDILFLEGYNQNLIAEYADIGQKIFILTPQNYDLFQISTTGASCFDTIREMMYQNLNYNTTISVSCLPRYYMEPNDIIYIEDKESNICGNYQITQFTLPLSYNGTMNITATEVLTRI